MSEQEGRAAHDARGWLRGLVPIMIAGNAAGEPMPDLIALQARANDLIGTERERLDQLPLWLADLIPIYFKAIEAHVTQRAFMLMATEEYPYIALKVFDGEAGDAKA